MTAQADRPVPFIHVRLQENRTPTGRRTSTPARRAALYYAYGRQREDRLAGRQRGAWLKPDGTVTDHEEVMAWIRAEAPQHRYTFQGLLSVPEGALPGPAFCQALRRGGQIDSWRLITHTDTQHRHAHVLWFGDERLKKDHFLAWQQAVRAELAALVPQYPAVDMAAEQAVSDQPGLGRRQVRGQEASFG